jgi:hypothetical protein
MSFEHLKCPICNREMKEGVIQSARTIFFTTEPHSFFFKPDNAGSKEITLSKHNWTRPTCKAYHCEKCKKILLDYEDESV